MDDDNDNDDRGTGGLALLYAAAGALVLIVATAASFAFSGRPDDELASALYRSHAAAAQQAHAPSAGPGPSQRHPQG
jgi:hypothetical protein